jgi:BASS family bile acid:Na+ symporter
MTAIIVLVLKASIILSVFAIGLKATFRDAVFLFSRPNQLVRAWFSMSVVMPVFALTLVMLFDLHPAIQIALIAISVSPIPPIFPNKAFKKGGTENYTIGLLVGTALVSIIVIPVAMELVERIVGIPLQMRARDVAWTVLTTIFLPLLAGIAVRALAPGLADRVAKPIALVSLVLLILSALPVLVGMTRPIWSLVGNGTLLALTVFGVVGFVVGHVLGGPEPANRPTLALATATRHPAVALGIAHANFPDQHLAPAAVFLYLMVVGVLSALYMAWAKRHEVLPASSETKHTVKA